MGVAASELRRLIVTKRIVMRNESIVTNLSLPQALNARDAISKFMYHSLFEWLMHRVNENLTNNADSQVKQFIGVLDIYGFEHFKRNSFEQFCINYANEKLQQEFNQHVFKLEQEVGPNLSFGGT
jgi:myosin-5